MMKEDTPRKVTIGYVPQTRTWHLVKQTPSASRGSPLLFWGANRSALRLNPYQDTKSSQGKPILFNGLMMPRKGKKMLGPLMGILTVRNGPTLFSGSRRNFIDIIRTGQKTGAIVFVFTPQDINWMKETVQGYLYHSELKQWIPCLFPLPNVVYNRIPNRMWEQKREVQSCLRQLANHPNIHLFNPCFFNKEEIFRVLKSESQTSPYLPETQPLQTKAQFTDMLKHHLSVYLKPTQGKAGEGIFKADYDPAQKLYSLSYHFSGRTRRLSSRSVHAIWITLMKLKKEGTYLIQETIPLACYNDSPFDIRTLVQKNKRGRWEVTGMGLRVAGPNRITTHVPQGGHIEQVDPTLSQIFPNQAEEIQSHVKQLALTVAKTLEKHYRHLGEISLDIGLDQEGNLWVFEANAKPMKFDEPHIRKKSLINLIEYVQYLTFRKPDKGADHRDLAPAN
jgi:hypothetical protein